MTDLANFLDSLLRWTVLSALASAAGGVVFVVVVLGRPGPPALAARARTRVLLLVAGAAVAAAVLELLELAVQLWAVAGGSGPWPVGAFGATDPARAGLVRVVLALALAAAAGWRARRPPSLAGSALVTVLAAALMADSAWLSHAFSRLEHRGLLMTLDAVHQFAAATWVGGLVCLLACRPVWRQDAAFANGVLARFSTLAVAAVLGSVGAGAWLGLHYVDSLAGLLGTGYGIMLVAKLLLLAAALALGALNFVSVRRARAGGRVSAPGSFRLVEAEIGIAITIVLVAASLTSQPPAIDVGPEQGRVPVGEMLGQLAPRLPRVTSPPVARLLAADAGPEDDPPGRSWEDRAWSEYNHNMAGLFVIAMGLLACAERTRRMAWARGWPILFLGLAVFMFFRDDPEAWPLGPAGFWATFRSPEVLQHRVFVLLVATLGLFEWLVRTDRLRSAAGRFVFPVLCAVGGALLLAHSHPGLSPTDESLAEVSHAAIGIFAVFLGWGRWLELRLPPPPQRLPRWIWAASMVLIGMVLVFYREI